jgi:hypothetical protein
VATTARQFRQTGNAEGGPMSAAATREADLAEKALQYLAGGLSLVPCSAKTKQPESNLLPRDAEGKPTWGPYQKKAADVTTVRSWFAGGCKSIAAVGGKVSGELLSIDFDEARFYDAWREQVGTMADGLAVQRTGREGGGYQVWLRCANPGRNDKLAWVSDDTEKTGRRIAIETRAEGGYAILPGSLHPSGRYYEAIAGSFTNIPIVPQAVADALIAAARKLDEAPHTRQQIEARARTKTCNRYRAESNGQASAIDTYNARVTIEQALESHGYTRRGDRWVRPGGKSASVTIQNGRSFHHSSNDPLGDGYWHRPFDLFCALEHGDDCKAAAKLLKLGGEPRAVSAGMADRETLSPSECGNAGGDGSAALSPTVGKSPAYLTPPSSLEPADPGALPAELLRAPGLISEVMDHCLATAPYPNIPLAFCGALALQAVLAGRKVRDRADNRSNIYVMALAYPSVGKDWPRKVNTLVLHRAGLADSLGQEFASGEGIQDALFRTPAMLFQNDEIDGLLRSINKAHDARYENIMGTLLTMYSASNSIYPMRRKAGKESSGAIDQPCLVIYGTAIPNHYYGALSERMLTNGLFARMLIVESGPRSAGQEPGIIAPPPRVMETARWWAALSRGAGNLEHFHPEPHTVEADDNALRLLAEARQASEAEYAAAESRGDMVGTTVWGRVPEQIRKLALLYAVSASHESPRIDVAAVRWATEVILHQTRRMLFMAHSHVAENEFDATCLKVLRKLREAPGQKLDHSVLLKRMKLYAETFQRIMETLIERGDVAEDKNSTNGRSQHIYIISGCQAGR